MKGLIKIKIQRDEESISSKFDIETQGYSYIEILGVIEHVKQQILKDKHHE